MSVSDMLPWKNRSTRISVSFHAWALVACLLLTVASLHLQIKNTSRNTTVVLQKNLSYDAPVKVFDSSVAAKNPRKPLADDEFYHVTNPSNLTERVSPGLPDWEAEKNRLRLQPLWNCKDPTDQPHPQSRLVYLHMSRSAGTTMRPVLRAYSNMCHRSISFISQCVDLGLESTEGSNVWSNGETGPYAARDCWLTNPVDRQGNDVVPKDLKGRINTKFLKENPMDIIAGHVSLGVHEIWPGDYMDEPQYIVMMREPITRYVSEIVFRFGSNDMDVKELVSLVNKTANGILNGHSGYRDSYSSYFITPKDMLWFDIENVPLTVKRRVNVALHNLFRHKVLVGLFERIPESFQMMQYVMDSKRDMDDLFHYFSKPSDSLSQRLKGNSKTQEVVARVTGDSYLNQILGEILKFDMQVYSAAKLLHEYQHQWMIEDMGEQWETSQHENE